MIMLTVTGLNMPLTAQLGAGLPGQSVCVRLLTRAAMEADKSQ